MPESSLPILFLLFVANGAPIVLRKLMGARLGWAVDWGCRWLDGRPLFGPSKTWRGVAGAVLFTAVATAGLGWGWGLGLAFGGLAMAGDLFSSFVKRRLGIASSGMAMGLDQIPEALLPLLGLRGHWQLDLRDAVWLSLAFLVLELLASRVLFWLHIRNRPY